MFTHYDILQVINKVLNESEIKQLFKSDICFNIVNFELTKAGNINQVSECLCNYNNFNSTLDCTHFIGLLIKEFLNLDPKFDREQFFINCCQSTDEYGKVITNYIRL